MIYFLMRNRITTIIGMLLLALSIYYGQSQLLSLFSYGVYPILNINHRICCWYETYVHAHQEREALYAQLAAVTRERDALLQQHIIDQACCGYEAQTAEMQQFKERYDDAQARLVQIVYRQLTSAHQYLLIDQGSRDGIVLNMIAVYHHHLVGKVTEVFPWYSKVTLMTDGACTIAAYVPTTMAYGIHAGANTPETKLLFVSHLDTVHVGDSVMSSGRGTIFPQGFFLGTVATCTKRGVVYDISVRPSCDFKAIPYCYILSRFGAAVNDGVET